MAGRKRRPGLQILCWLQVIVCEARPAMTSGLLEALSLFTASSLATAARFKLCEAAQKLLTQLDIRSVKLALDRRTAAALASEFGSCAVNLTKEGDHQHGKKLADEGPLGPSLAIRMCHAQLLRGTAYGRP